MASQLTSELALGKSVHERVATSRRRPFHVAAAAMVRQLPDEAAYLVPLRLFLGLGWLRAAVEKLLDPAWWNGSAVEAFLRDHAEAGLTLPFYEPVASVVHRFAAPVGVGVLATEAIIAVAVLVGYRTSAALLAALFLNANFILAGQTNPSVFYMLVELVLLAGGAGAMCGVDGRPTSSASAPTDTTECRAATHRRLVRLIVVSGVLAITLLPFAATLAPAEVINDPALVLSLVLLLTASGAGLRIVRTGPPTP